MNIQISDITLRECEQEQAAKLSFKEKQEVAKLLEKLNTDIIETGYIGQTPADAVFIRMLAGAIERSTICVPVAPSKDSINESFTALSKAKKPRLNLIVPTSVIGMEYSCQMKPDAMLALISELVAYAKTLCGDVEFTADDAMRSEGAFLAKAIDAAIGAGAGTVTLRDSGGELLPGELGSFIDEIYKSAPRLKDVTLGLHLKDSLGLACASALRGIACGIGLLKVSGSSESDTLSLEAFLNILKIRGESLGITCSLSTTSYMRICAGLSMITGVAGAAVRKSQDMRASGTETSESASAEPPANAGITELGSYIRSIGYDVSDDDLERIFAQYKEIEKSKKVVADDVEALIAETAGQAPPTYKLKNFVINSGSAITATAYIEFEKNGNVSTALSAGDGPIDAAFKAAETIFGTGYELEDFRIHAVTSGREATGDALIKLRCDGKLYSGRGVSTDIVAASIRAYLSAVNKIINEV